MKLKKKVLALLFVVTMVMGMSMTAFAAGNYSITIDQVAGATVAHTYEAYQIFAGDFDEATGTLSNVVWGANIGGNFTYDNVEYGPTAAPAKDLAKALEDPASDVPALAKAVAPVLTGAPAATATEASVGAGVTISGLDDGYYLVKDADGSLDGEADSYSRYMVQVAGSSVGVKAKADVPSTIKKVKDVNDSNGEATDWQDSADYDIGDDVPFMFKSTIVANISDYVNEYIYTFHDTLSEGLTLNVDSVTAKVGDADVLAQVVPTANGFDVITKDLRAYTGDVVVEYTAKLNDKAVIGKPGNPNEMYLEYSNNPNGEGTGKTPVDKVVVFTYKVEVDKVDENQQPLSGAEFSLEKLVDGQWVQLALVTSEDGSVFSFSGLDDGDYRIAETGTPAGYNTISDPYINFTVVANHQVEADDPQLESIDANVTGETVGTYVFTKDLELGLMSTEIINQSGSLLPSTGGIGTTIFYIIGIILVLGAGAILFVRKTMNRNNY